MDQSLPPVIRDPRLDAHDGLVHGFFSRAGGLSTGIYASLNTGPGSADTAANVAANRDRAGAALGLGRGRIITAHQTHSADVVTVETPWQMGAAPRADGLVTRVPGWGLGVLAADCAPVLLADNEARVIATVHAGWRGALAGVIQATVDAMVALGARPRRLTAAIGPCIGQPSYEVGAEFPAPFLDQNPANQVFFRAAPREAHYLFDLGGFVAACLVRAGLRPVPPSTLDTCVLKDRFFSYRRSVLDGEPDYGRNISVIALSE
ncbi:MAG: peptidoglycan editing factor PgeF [Alphaproteobacteria bacterium]|nr:MAG: peptidoglycan editing factor PgeF [Alphaproteobacteria bacterium]